MKDGQNLPHILIIDDLLGRVHTDRRNEERANFCGQYLLEDVTDDQEGKGIQQRIKEPIARAVFWRGQRPIGSTVGDVVENDVESTLMLIKQGGENIALNKPNWSLVLLDLCFYTGKVTEQSNRRTLGMPEGRDADDNPRYYFGLHLLERIHGKYPDIPIIILSSKPREEVSHEFSAKGALAFLAREDKHSPELLREYLWRHGLIPDSTGAILGRSKSLLLALRNARRVSSGRRNIFLRGERGTGKELFAKFIHSQSQDNSSEDRPFVVIDSGTLSPTLYASELFGHTRGSFTGADRDREGSIVQANGGDLFLDEIGNIPHDVQIGLLRVCQQREVISVGAKKGQPVDVRFLSATNEGIEKKIVTGKFRADLLDRLQEGGTIYLPPLRYRKQDIPMLVEKFVRDAEGINPKTLSREIDPDTLDLLIEYDWPGNIRELENCIHRAVNDHPDVEHFVPIHINLPEHSDSHFYPVRTVPCSTPGYSNIESVAKLGNVDDIVEILDTITFESFGPEQLSGKLPLLEEACVRLVARYIKSVIEMTRRPTPDEPEGKILIHPAMKFATGNKRLTASKAADIIKRLIGRTPDDLKPLLSDGALSKALQTAVRLRPRQSSKQKSSKHSK